MHDLIHDIKFQVFISNLFWFIEDESVKTRFEFLNRI